MAVVTDQLGRIKGGYNGFTETQTFLLTDTASSGT
jgi:hypothetical protein